MGGRAAAALAAVITLASGACGGSQGTVGVSEAEAPPSPIDLSLRSPDGEYVDVGELRGRTGMIFLFATFDGRSQASLRSLRRFVRTNPEVWVLGVALQPEARQLLDAWVAALDPPFPVAYDPTDSILSGTTALGEVDGVPTFVIVDEDGYERDRTSGFASEVRLQQMLERAQEPRR